jgi:hypothetical protein
VEKKLHHRHDFFLIFVLNSYYAAENKRNHTGLYRHQTTTDGRPGTDGYHPEGYRGHYYSICQWQ